jgi:hypothetical protein
MHVCRKCHEFLSGHGNIDPAEKLEKKFQRPDLKPESNSEPEKVGTIYLAGDYHTDQDGRNWREEIHPLWGLISTWDKDSNAEFAKNIKPWYGFGNPIKRLDITGPFPYPGTGPWKVDPMKLTLDALRRATHVFCWFGDRTSTAGFFELGFTLALSKEKEVGIYHEQEEAYFIASPELMNYCVDQFVLGYHLATDGGWDFIEAVEKINGLREKVYSQVLGVMSGNGGSIAKQDVSGAFDHFICSAYPADLNTYRK